MSRCDFRGYKDSWRRTLNYISVAGIIGFVIIPGKLCVKKIRILHKLTKPNLVKHSEDLLMAEKPAYEELEQKVKELQEEANKGERAEEALGSMHRKLQAAFDAIQADMSVVDLDFNLTDVNEYLIEAFGLPDKKSVLGRKCFEVLKGRKDVCPDCVIAEVYQTKAAAYRTTTPEDEIATGGRSFEIFAYPIVDRDGNLSGAVEFARDVTERKQAEKALKKAHDELEQKVLERTAKLAKANKQLKREIQERGQAEESLRKSEEEKANILETMSELVLYVDTDMKILWANRAAADSVSLTADALIGKYCYKEWFQTSEPCPHCPAKKIFETGQPQEGETYSPDGRVWHFRGYPVKDENGKIIGIVEVVEEITKRKQAEALIIEKSRDLECILENAPIGLSYLDSEMRFMRTNRFVERKFGLKSEEIRSQHCYDVIGQYAGDDTRKGKDRICDTCQVVKTLKDGKIHTHERVIRPDYIVRNTSAPIKDQNGSIIGAIELIEDITALKQAEEEKKKIETQFREAQKMEAVGTLAGGIAHDFNNLLTTIQGTASLMLFDIDSTHPHYERLQTITKQVWRGASLTAQLLGYASKGRYEVKPISLNQIVEETSDTFGRTHKEITIHLELTEDLSSIEADQSQIEQVLLNLYINASGAMLRGGTLTLKTVNITRNNIKNIAHNIRSGSYALLTVTDTGTGMDKEVRDRIFEPFFTTKQMGRGTGLGLASVYGIIKGHRGYIHVDSEKGRGTTFSIYLPASDKEIVTVIKPAGCVIEGSGTILLVDDEDSVLDTSVMMLEKTGYTVLEAKGGREAVEIYEANNDKIDLVILDMIMPDMGGGEAYDKMKEINPDVKVLLSSGYSIEGEASEILDRGCDSFIQKPFNLKKLSEKIRELLDM